MKGGTLLDYAREFIGEGKMFLKPDDLDTFEDRNLGALVHVADLRSAESFAEGLQHFSA